MVDHAAPARRRRPSQALYDEKTCSKFGTLSARYLSVLQSRTLKDAGLSVNGWRVLSIIARFAPLNATEVSRHTSLQPDKVTRSINGLVEAAFVHRVTDASDRRRVIVSLTTRGAATFRRVSACGIEFERWLFDVLTADEVHVLDEILAKLLQRSAPG